MFGNWLIRKIAYSGLTLKQVARKSGVPIETLFRLINNTKEPRVGVAWSLAQCFKMPLSEVVYEVKHGIRKKRRLSSARKDRVR